MIVTREKDYFITLEGTSMCMNVSVQLWRLVSSKIHSKLRLIKFPNSEKIGDLDLH